MNVNKTKLNLCIKSLKDKLKRGELDNKEYNKLVDLFTVYYLAGGL